MAVSQLSFEGGGAAGEREGASDCTTGRDGASEMEVLADLVEVLAALAVPVLVPLPLPAEKSKFCCNLFVLIDLYDFLS